MRGTPEVIILYVCPTDGCHNYYGTSSMGRIDEKWNYDIKGDRTTQRSRCPECGALRVRRYARLIPPDEVRRAFQTVKATTKEDE